MGWTQHRRTPSSLAEVFQPFLWIAKFDSWKEYLSGISWCCNPNPWNSSSLLKVGSVLVEPPLADKQQSIHRPMPSECLRCHFIIVICIVFSEFAKQVSPAEIRNFVHIRLIYDVCFMSRVGGGLPAQQGPHNNIQIFLWNGKSASQKYMLMWCNMWGF